MDVKNDVPGYLMTSSSHDLLSKVDTFEIADLAVVELQC